MQALDLRDRWGSLSTTQRRIVGATAIGLAGVAVWAVALRQRSGGEVGRAVKRALAELGDAASPEDVASSAYWALYPDCPRHLDPEDPEHATCIERWRSVHDEARKQMGCLAVRPPIERYRPGSPEQVALFREAAKVVGVPEAWASDPAIAFVLAHESAGSVGRPNYTYGWRAKERACWPGIWDELRRGDVRARSSATGLGQMLLKNVDEYYPSGREGIGVALEEAAGMLAYIDDRYGTPTWARNCWGKLCPKIPGKRPKGFKEGY